MGLLAFSMPKREIFRKVKENKHFRGGVLLYAAQENVKFDTEIAEKGRFGMKTNSVYGFLGKNVMGPTRCTVIVLSDLPCGVLGANIQGSAHLLSTGRANICANKSQIFKFLEPLGGGGKLDSSRRTQVLPK